MSKPIGKSMKAVFAVLGGAGLIFLMLSMTGTFRKDRIEPGSTSRMSSTGGPPGKITEVSLKTVTEFYDAVGTVRPKTETRVESQVTGRILKVLVRPGDQVREGMPLVILDSRENQTRLDQARQQVISSAAIREQAEQAVSAARAVLSEAESAYKRVQTYYKAEAATKQDLEKAESSYLQAKAGLSQALDGLRKAKAGVRQVQKGEEAARIALGYNTILAHEEGEVAKRLAEPGDLAFPGKPLIILQTREALRLEAFVREGLIRKIKIGEPLEVIINALDISLKGTVEEIVPSADPATRTFLIKTGLPFQEGLFPGMFGKLRIPVMQRTVLLVPSTSIRRVGQLEIVTVKRKDRWERVYVKTGMSVGDQVEILSGLSAREQIAIVENAS